MSDADGDDAGRSGFTAADTKLTLAEACDAVGLDCHNAALLRLGENAIYRLPDVPAVARIARTADYLRDVRAEVDVARWLEEVEFPAVRLTGPADQPVAVDGRLVTFWELLPDSDNYGTTWDLAELLRWLHRLEPSSWLDLPKLDPFRRVELRIELAAVADDDRAFLFGRLAELRDPCSTVSSRFLRTSSRRTPGRSRRRPG